MEWCSRVEIIEKGGVGILLLIVFVVIIFLLVWCEFDKFLFIRVLNFGKEDCRWGWRWCGGSGRFIILFMNENEISLV